MPIKPLFKRLLHSHHDLMHAQKCVNQILKRKLHNTNERFEKELLECLNSAMITAYSKPFSGNKGSSGVAKEIPVSILSCLTDDELNIHKKIISMRNQDIAHSDPDSRNIEVEISKYDGASVATPKGSDPYIPFDDNDTTQIAEIIKKLLNQIRIEQNNIEKTLGVGKF